MNELLTIAIPTYNRLEKFKITINHIIELTRDFNLEIIISDNASTDGTKEYSERIVEKNKNIKYYRNETNLGFDGNFLNCFVKASGKYIWIFSDDDLLLDGAIESTLRIIKKYNPVCIQLNTSTISKNGISKPRLIENDEIVYTNKNDFLRDINIYCTFISSLVFNKELVDKVPNKQRYFGTNILQSHVFLQLMKNEGAYVINTKNCVASTVNENVNYDVYQTWVKNYSDLMLVTAKECGFEESLIEKVLEENLSNIIFSFIMKFRISCKDSNKWNKEAAFSVIKRFPKLKHKYKFAIKSPVFVLILYNWMKIVWSYIKK